MTGHQNKIDARRRLKIDGTFSQMKFRFWNKLRNFVGVSKWQINYYSIERKTEKYKLLVIFIMEPRMKVLQTSQRYFAALNICPQQSTQSKYFMNSKLLVGSILIGYLFVACVLYLICNADSFDKYIKCICMIIAIVVVATCFVSMVFGMSTLFECIDDNQHLIGTIEWAYSSCSN